MKEAALALVYKRGMVLTVARPDPPYEQSIPGGLIERGESGPQAAARELLEETGVEAVTLRYLGNAPSPTDGRTVHVYLVTQFRGAAYAREGHDVRWMSWRQLRAQAGRYGTFLDKIAIALQAA